MAKNPKKISRTKEPAAPIGKRGKVTGLSNLPVILVEDRGHIGFKGRRIFRVRADDIEEDPSITFEIAADEFVLTDS